jgi:antitoxin (DNA-binding transcriptional repressor) of toxin-antitoxin stability system
VQFVCPDDFGTTPKLPEGFKLLGKAKPIDPKDIKYDLYRLWRELYDPPFTVSSNGTGSAGGTKTAEPKDETIHLAKQGLPVAVLLPWQQTWTLKGFSRGNLISTLALAPGEETTITVSSWERRAKTMQQTAETDIEQTFDFTSTTRDTEDVFREVTSNNEFNAQAHGSLDASYSPGVASIRVSAGGQVENAQSLANACRTSTQHVRETTSRASTRVRSRRVTTITESIERESTTQVIRHIRNPNACHTLTMNFHEVLAHYEVDVLFKKDRVRIVVLVPNPVTVREFDELTVRVNEATLRLYLLDEALADGFEACRLLEAYRSAEAELRRLSTLSKEEKELDRERTEAPTTSPQKPENPQLAPLKSILEDLRRRAALFVNVDVAAALSAIAGHRTPTNAEVKSAQRWLWRRLVAAKFGGGLLGELDRLAGMQAATPDIARSLLAAAPPNGSVPTLDGLGGLSDQEKEDAGLAARIKSMPGYVFWDWGPFWYPNCKRDGLYDVDDGGIAGALAQLRSTFQAWEAKESEGSGLQAAAAVVAQANAEQAATTLADRLEMKFGVEIVGAAMERSEALRAHLNQHREYYRYVLFQAMPPSEQLQRLMDVAPQLRVGMFEPHVVASDGPNLAIPLSPLAETTLRKVVTNLAEELEKAAKEAEAAGDRIKTDSVILPTPGVSVESWLGGCSGCEEHLEKLRAAEARASIAQARLTELEGDRRKAMLDAGDRSDPDPTAEPSLHVRFEQVPPA